MKSTGFWYQGVFDGKHQWDINYSSILTRLIYYAGRYCENWASDLFEIWKYRIDENLHNREYEGETITFGFRENGVDTDREIEYKKDELGSAIDYYYRKICTLEITIKDDVITMELKGE